MDPSPADEYILFYMHDTPNYVLSNFYPHTAGKMKSLRIPYDGVEWPTSEHLYQALKFKNETEDEKKWREIIRTANTPGIAKHLGHFHRFRRYKWQQDATALVDEYRPKVRLTGDMEDLDYRADLMRVALKAKYDHCADFRQALQATGDSKLMEDVNDSWGWKHGLLGRLLEDLRDANR